MGNRGTGKTAMALRMAQILHRLAAVCKGCVASVTRDDPAGQYIGHTARQTRDVLTKAMDRGLFIGESRALGCLENERDCALTADDLSSSDKPDIRMIRLFAAEL